MRTLIIAAVITLALGVTVEDMSSSSGETPDQAWENRANSVVGEQTQARLSETGAEMREWLFAKMQEQAE